MTNLEVTNDRLLAWTYDSVRQAELFASAVNARAAVENTGTSASRVDDFGGASPSHDFSLVDTAVASVRLDVVLSRNLVLTDTQALDGAVVRELVLAGRLDSFARAGQHQLPIEIRTRAPDLESALVETYVDRANRRMRSFRPAAFSNGAHLQAELAAQAPPDPAIGIGGVLELLRSAGADEEEIKAADEWWRKLVEMERVGRLRTVMWTAQPTFEEALATAIRYEPASEMREVVLATDDGRHLLDEIGRNAGRRSDVYLSIDNFESTTRDERALDDAAWIRHWYDTVYLRAQAFQHGADFRGLPTIGFNTTDGQLQAQSRVGDKLVEVELPPAACKFFAAASDERWARLFSDYGGHLEAWWSTGNSDALRRFLESVDRAAVDYGVLAQPQRRVLAHVKNLGARYALAAAALPLQLDWLGAGVLAIIVTGDWVRGMVRSPVRVEVTDYGEQNGLQQAGELRP